MQISSASLLAAQQARIQTPPQSRAAQATSASEFEPLVFVAKTAASAPKLAPGAQPPASPVPFARPGSQIDIKV